ncbi:hypothetical protein CGT92_09470 [Vibrio metoecus]|uniref:Uncharacterized protein n=1 Tax=Vibrio metoecus TaxID=1481663 RepID=A0A271VU43_VIBMT|nr:hypothetical protein CGU03_06425 [Vibrio metoecus]PAR25464.1 hypothetical protein CGU02_05550 [Vibrio metoecus]PAR28601.1 hypothetical protein CGU00_07345 [Vibrio metoecus]PAR37320.1 hypothetical protein CGT97_03635 [Vibrio metoecus]PAR38153.1 hypothetical protein CGT98_15250 [Vibrio metoecus]
MLSAHHASNGPRRKQGGSSNIAHRVSVVLGNSSHILALLFYRARKPLRQRPKINTSQKLSTAYCDLDR